MSMLPRAVVLLGSLALLSAAEAFKFVKDQHVYIAGVDARNTKTDLLLERLAREQFVKLNMFRVADTMHAADFVFFVIFDPSSSRVDEEALAVLPSDYEHAKGDLDMLRNAALWRSDGHLKTSGVKALFRRPSVVAGLVKQFCDETGVK